MVEVKEKMKQSGFRTRVTHVVVIIAISLLLWLNLSLDLNFTTGYSSVSSTLMSYLDISDSWLNSTRYGNTDPGEEMLTNNILQGFLLLPKPDNNDAEFLRIPLSQSVALRNSSFLTWKEVPGDEAGTTHYDAHRLIYLAIHEHQHRPARKEAAKRIEIYKNPGKYSEWLAHLNKSNVGRFDYECRDAKLLISSIGNVGGLGYEIRKASAGVLLAGFNSGRVVNFVNNINGIQPWGLASCPRHDIQCFFMPLSPCVLTEAELKNATTIGVKELMQMLVNGKVDDHHLNNAKVLFIKHAPVVNLALAKQKQTRNLKMLWYEFVRSMYENHTESFSSVMSSDRFERALTKIGDPNEKWLMEGAAVSYIMRPNVEYSAKLTNRIDELFHADFDPVKALGIPIRASDKCTSGESECLSFENYTDLSLAFSRKKAGLLNLANTTINSTSLAHDSIVISTEAREILDLAIVLQKQQSFPLHLILNDQDVAQGTGNVKSISKSENGDEIMYSTFVSIQMQLMTGDTIVNCCSNVHKLLLIFLKYGYGRAPVNHPQCLQDNDNPAYRVRCAWG